MTNNIEEAVYLADRIVVLTNCPTRIKREYIIDLRGRGTMWSRSSWRSGKKFPQLWTKRFEEAAMEQNNEVKVSVQHMTKQLVICWS